MKRIMKNIVAHALVITMMVSLILISNPISAKAASTYSYTKSYVLNTMKQDPAMFLQTDYAVGLYTVGKMGSTVSSDIKNKAAELTANCKNDNEKINKIAHWVADYITYDLAYSNNANVNDIFVSKRGVCSAYARLSYAMLQSLNIPSTCLKYTKTSPGHEYNMAYDGSRWIIYDATWMRSTNGEKYYDMSCDFLFSLKSHGLYSAITPVYDQTPYFKGDSQYIEKFNTIYRIPYGSTITNWYMSSGNRIETDHITSNAVSLRTMELPNIKKINVDHYEYKSSLQYVILDYCETIESGAFKASSLKEVVVPATVKTIGEDVFSTSKNFKVKCLAGTVAEQYCIKNKIKYEIMQVDNPTTSITINANDISYSDSNNVTQLSAQVSPSGASANVAWSVETPSGTYGFAKITKDEKLTALYPGKVTLVATATDGTGVQAKKTINIVKKSADKTVKEVSISRTNYTYRGEYCKPNIKVTNSENKAVSSNYYTVTYSNNKDVGEATVSVTFKGIYANNAKVVKHFSIVPLGTRISKIKATPKKLILNVKAQKTQTSGYQVRYSTNKNMKGAKTITINNNTKLSVSISKLKAKKTYYLQIRTYKNLSGENYYSSWSQTYSKKTTK
ncbi:transglutaminase domain-containing protein [Aminicella lysinilytica]|uniref:Leucine rich repeat (LRR) protein n=1 Tax=Aminicella lysinilytica TaxID=433323 RepID=A0A4R6Q115_9FIRM|nr:transglutaminase domain-containing protein [Aminicella lysinilytica]TDP50806.1 leucine rich repeat (LRR) protein [Aminicella lysinilytica]